MIPINEVADFFILKADSASGDLMTHLKLQKLVYYAEAWHLAIYGESLVADDFEAWAHGPVAPSLFSRFTGYGFSAIPPNVVRSRIDDESALSHLAEVWQVYGGHSAKALEQQTHSEEPWIEARGECAPLERCTNVILKRTMREFYGRQLKDGEEE